MPCDDFEFNDSVGPSHLGSEGEGAELKVHWTIANQMMVLSLGI